MISSIRCISNSVSCSIERKCLSSADNVHLCPTSSASGSSLLIALGSYLYHDFLKLQMLIFFFNFPKVFLNFLSHFISLFFYFVFYIKFSLLFYFFFLLSILLSSLYFVLFVLIKFIFSYYFLL